MSLFTETIRVWHPGEETGEYDSLGRPIKTDSTETDEPGWYEPRASSEDVVAKDQQVHGYWVYMPRGVHVTPQSRIRIEGDWHEVDGEPGRMPDGFLISGYIAVAVRRVTG